MGRSRRILALAVVGMLLGSAPPARAANCAGTSVGRTPLNDLGAGTYQGVQGGLYPGGANVRPAHHEALGQALARTVVPRNPAGLPDPATGKIVFLSIGMSNTNQESSACATLAAPDPLRHPNVRFVNGAQGGQDARRIADPNAAYWAYVDGRLTASQATPAQVQTVWLKEAVAGPSGGFPAAAREFEGFLRTIAQILQTRFPNLRLAYLSSRIYAGYASTGLNPEPYAYENGFSVKWLIQSQIDGTYPLVEPMRGVVAPWLSWGPYLWADGLNARSDGLVWLCSDLAADGTHPSGAGAQKVGSVLREFVRNDTTASIWYRYAGSPPA